MDLLRKLIEVVGALDGVEVFGGHQSRVFRLAMADGRLVAAKVLTSSMVDAELVHARIEAVADLAEIDSRVCRPWLVDGRLVTLLASESEEPVLLVCSEFVDGSVVDASRSEDAELMGIVLAGLHSSLARLAPRDIPMVGALELGSGSTVRTADYQLLHGDFNARNLRRVGDLAKVFDFEDCGYGPPTFDIANALYMVLFDVRTCGRGDEEYRKFAETFVAGYASASTNEVDLEHVGVLMQQRVAALQRWLGDLASAPIGIRTATPKWQSILREFVDNFSPHSL